MTTPSDALERRRAALRADGRHGLLHDSTHAEPDARIAHCRTTGRTETRVLWHAPAAHRPPTPGR